MRVKILSFVALTAVCFAAGSEAQTVPSPTKNFAMDYAAQWDQTYPATAGAALAGKPFIKEVRIDLGPVGVLTVPRASVTKLPATGTPTTLQVTVTVPFGNLTAVARFASEEGLVSDPSNAVPFVSTGPKPAPPVNFRAP